MQRRRTGRVVVAAIVLLTAAAVAGAAATGRLPQLKRTWGTVASAVASVASPPASSGAPSGPVGDGGAATADAAGGDALPRRQTAPLSSAQLGAPLVHGAFVTACGAPDDMKVVIKADVRLGRAIKVSVKTEPPNLMIASCIERATRDLQWDVSPKVGHVTVRY